MAIVPRTAAAPLLDAAPFIYGIRHAPDLRAGLIHASPSESVRLFREGAVDLALVPASSVPSLPDAAIVTEYCIGSSGPVDTAVLAGRSPAAEARRVYLDPEAPTSAQLVAYLYKRHWRTTPEFIASYDPDRTDGAPDGELFLIAGERAFGAAERFASVCDLGDAWTRTTRQPFAFAVWVARKDADPESVEALRQALTCGLEHTYEAVIEGGWTDKPYDAYGHLSRRIDYIFDRQKQQALRKFWDSGIKVAPRANPG